MLVTITQASKLVGKARKTLYAHAKAGKVSLSKFADGRTAIDTSELHRFYGEFKKEVTLTQNKKAENVTDGNVTMELLNELKNENALMREEMQKLRAEISNLTNRLEYKPLPSDKTKNKNNTSITGLMAKLKEKQMSENK